jgi:phosphoglycolate phosphatase-like HAD superfamily hydrolase
MNRMQICLFDTDGTLLRSGGAGKAAMEMSLQQTLGAIITGNATRWRSRRVTWPVGIWPGPLQQIESGSSATPSGAPDSASFHAYINGAQS